MSNYRLEFSPIIGSNDTERLNNLLGIVSGDDELEITMGNGDIEQANSIIGVLENNDFEVSTKRGHIGGKYHLIAHRRN